MGKHYEWRKQAKKTRRKRIRQSLAIARCAIEKEEEERQLTSKEYQEWLQEQNLDEEFQEKEEARLAAERHSNWLCIEEEAQKQWQVLQLKLQEAREEDDRQRLIIRMEWQKEQKRLKQLEEEQKQKLEKQLQRERELQEEIEHFVNVGGSTPEQLKVFAETNPGKPICPFHQKTFTCRFGDECSRNHVKPGVSRILMIANFYSHYSLLYNENEHGTDSSLEYEQDETYADFKEFFYDVVPELERAGRIRQFKVCCNRTLHLRGNTYVEYETTREAVTAYRIFNGRWYGGRQITVQFCTIPSWRAAICGLYFKKACPKGALCNFLHIFDNPHKFFANTNHEYHRRPKRATITSRWSESPERRLNWDEDITESTKRRSSRHRDKYSPKWKRRKHSSERSSKSHRSSSTRSTHSRHKKR